MSEIEKQTGEFIVSDTDKILISSLVPKIMENTTYEGLPVIDHDHLSDLLTKEEISVVDRVYDINPKMYGFKAPKQTLEPVPEKLIRVEPQPFSYQGVQGFTETQYIPEAPYYAFQAMAAAMKDEIGRELLVESSYRSNPYQAITFLWILKIYDFDVPKTAQRAAIPGYSEHGTPSSLAIDVKNVDGLPSDATPLDFEATIEYDWLLANANKFDFFLSYPKDNQFGVMFEPWHWRHNPSANS